MKKSDELLSIFPDKMTKNRKNRLIEIINNRTEYLRLVIQDVVNPHNISACLRSADAFGIMNVDVISSDKIKTNKVDTGIFKWLKIENYSSVETCYDNLKQNGYRIGLAIPSNNSIPLEQVPLSNKMAIIFSNEHKGVDPAWFDLCDFTFHIPMFGAVESLNVSVAAAISLQNISHRARLHESSDYFLSACRQKEVISSWLVQK